MNEKEFDIIIKNQIKITNNKALDFCNRIIEEVAYKTIFKFYYQGILIEDIKFRKNKLYMIFEHIYGSTEFPNPIKHNELEYVIGLNEVWFGINGDYIIRNQGNSAASIFKFK